MTDVDDWQPTCTMATLRLRAVLLKAVRQFFAERRYLEVETPLLSQDIVVDAHLEPFEVQRSADDRRLFLQTSPEAGMKRLLAAGSGSIFQVTRSFRQGESGPRHNPEFTMVEWYGVGTSWQDQKTLTEELLRFLQITVGRTDSAETGAVPTVAFSDQPFPRTSYAEAFRKATDLDVLDATVAQLQSLVAQSTSVAEQAFAIEDKDDLLNILLAEHVEPQLGLDQPEFLHSYPVSQAALAEVNPDDDRTARRFELFFHGLELCNGYQELTDPEELRRRDSRQNQGRAAHAVQTLPGATRMLAAMESGLPDCSGVALGFDRLLMALLGCQNMQQVIPFPIDRA